MEHEENRLEYGQQQQQRKKITWNARNNKQNLTILSTIMLRIEPKPNHICAHRLNNNSYGATMLLWKLCVRWRCHAQFTCAITARRSLNLTEYLLLLFFVFFSYKRPTLHTVNRRQESTTLSQTRILFIRLWLEPIRFFLMLLLVLYWCVGFIAIAAAVRPHKRFQSDSIVHVFITSFLSISIEWYTHRQHTQHIDIVKCL